MCGDLCFVPSPPDRAVCDRDLAGNIIALCSWARHFTPTLPLSTHVYKWVLAKIMAGVTLWWTSIPSRGSRNTPTCPCHKNQDWHYQDVALGSYADFTLTARFLCLTQSKYQSNLYHNPFLPHKINRRSFFTWMSFESLSVCMVQQTN